MRQFKDIEVAAIDVLLWRFGDEHDSWEPYKGLMHVGKLHDYLRANHMKALIPKEHR